MASRSSVTRTVPKRAPAARLAPRTRSSHASQLGPTTRTLASAGRASSHAAAAAIRAGASGPTRRRVERVRSGGLARPGFRDQDSAPHLLAAGGHAQGPEPQPRDHPRRRPSRAHLEHALADGVHGPETYAEAVAIEKTDERLRRRRGP